MHEFMTVKMVAIKAMDYAEFPVAEGEEFYATPDDARYFEKHGRARRAPLEPSIEVPTFKFAKPDEPSAPRRGRPRKQVEDVEAVMPLNRNADGSLSVVGEVAEVAEDTAIEAPEADAQQ